jgi:hypothetical protein
LTFYSISCIIILMKETLRKSITLLGIAASLGSAACGGSSEPENKGRATYVEYEYERKDSRGMGWSEKRTLECTPDDTLIVNTTLERTNDTIVSPDGTPITSTVTGHGTEPDSPQCENGQVVVSASLESITPGR